MDAAGQNGCDSEGVVHGPRGALTWPLGINMYYTQTQTFSKLNQTSVSTLQWSPIMLINPSRLSRGLWNFNV